MGDGAYSIQQTSDGGYIVGGWSESNDGDVSGNNGSYDYWIVKLASNTAINDFNAITSLEVYPNPVSNDLKLRISLSRPEQLSIHVRDLLGQCVMDIMELEGIQGDQLHSISTSKLANGIYLLEVTGEYGIMTKRIIVNHE